MSTILKSLKKLEKERETNRYPAQAAGYIGPGAVAAAGGSSRRKKGVWIRWCFVVLLIAGLGASSYYFYRQSQRHSPLVSQTAKTSQPPVQPTARGTAAKSTGNIPPLANPRPMAKAQEQPSQNIQGDGRRPVAQPAPATSASNRQPVPAIAAGSTPQPPSATAQPLPADRPASAPTHRVVRPQDRPQHPPQAATVRNRPPTATSPALQPSPSARIQNSNRPVPQKQTRPTNAYDDLRPLTDGRLKIQAIVWSDNQSDRMAVINTQIVHEGNSVDGFDVVAIRQEDIVVRGEGGEMYRVLFGRP